MAKSPTAAPPASPAPLQAPPPPLRPAVYRVSLPHAKARLLDERGVAYYQDYLDVQAHSPAEAFDAFKQALGISRTDHAPTITPLETPQQ